MTVIGADAVRSLRERTGAGMMDCKAALESSSGDLEKAIDFLRKKGVAQAAKRAGREAKEGLVLALCRRDQATLVEANCETDFVARTDDFRALAQMALEEAFLCADQAAVSEKIARKVEELSGKIGEKIVVRRTKLVNSKSGTFFSYVHSNLKLAVVLELAGSSPAVASDTAFQELGKHLAMQVAASNPICVSREEVSSNLIDREKAIYREELKGKPENILDKIIQGKLNKFYQTVCLLEQPFIRDDKKSVRLLMDETAKKLSSTLAVKQFVRFQLGESV